MLRTWRVMPLGNATVAVAVVLAMLAACAGRGATETLCGIGFERVEADTTVALAENDGAPTCNVSASIAYAVGRHAQTINGVLVNAGVFPPEFAVGADARNASQLARTIVDNCAKNYMRDYAPLYRGDADHGQIYTKQISVKARAYSYREGIIVYAVTTSERGGDGMAEKHTSTININANTGKVLTHDDLFLPGSDRFIERLIARRLRRKYGAKDDNGLKAKGILAGEDIYISDNFVIGKHDITYIYAADEIAPHDFGEIRVSISYGEFGKLSKINRQ